MLYSIILYGEGEVSRGSGRVGGGVGGRVVRGRVGKGDGWEGEGHSFKFSCKKGQQNHATSHILFKGFADLDFHTPPFLFIKAR